MDLSKFSLDYLQPSGATQPVTGAQSDPWSDAVRFYSVPVLKTLQQEGKKSIGDLFQITKEQVKDKVNVQYLQLGQFTEVIRRMTETGQLSIAEESSDPEKTVVTLPLAERVARRA
jgi:hypothetical protein